MRNDISKIRNRQIPSAQGRAAEATASIVNLLNIYFSETSFNEMEDCFNDLTQSFLSPDPSVEFNRDHVANTIYGIRNVSNLLRKLEAINEQLKGGASC